MIKIPFLKKVVFGENQFDNALWTWDYTHVFTLYIRAHTRYVYMRVLGGFNYVHPDHLGKEEP